DVSVVARPCANKGIEAVPASGHAATHVYGPLPQIAHARGPGGGRAVHEGHAGRSGGGGGDSCRRSTIAITTSHGTGTPCCPRRCSAAPAAGRRTTFAGGRRRRRAPTS